MLISLQRFLVERGPPPLSQPKDPRIPNQHTHAQRISLFRPQLRPGKECSGSLVDDVDYHSRNTTGRCFTCAHGTKRSPSRKVPCMSAESCVPSACNLNSWATSASQGSKWHKSRLRPRQHRSAECRASVDKKSPVVYGAFISSWPALSRIFCAHAGIEILRPLFHLFRVILRRG